MSVRWSSSSSASGSSARRGGEADAQLERGLAATTSVEVDPGAQKQWLAGGEAVAAAEDGGDAFLGSQVLLATTTARGAGRPDVDLAGLAVGAFRGLVARAVADPHRDGALGGEGGPTKGSAAATAWAWSASLTRAIPASTTASVALLRSDRRRQPGRPRLGPLERLEGADRHRPSQRHLRRWRRGLALAGSTAPARRPRRGGDRLQDQHAVAVLALAPRQVATVGERQRPGEVELGESEEGAQGPSLVFAARVAAEDRFGEFFGWSGSEYFEG